MEIEEGIIETTSEVGKKLGFTKNIFGTGSYMWYRDGYIWFSMIVVKEEKRNKGHLKRLIKNIEDKGFKIKIPTPLSKMKQYLEKYDWKKTTEIVTTPGGNKEPIEVWVRQ